MTDRTLLSILAVALLGTMGWLATEYLGTLRRDQDALFTYLIENLDPRLRIVEQQVAALTRLLPAGPTGPSHAGAPPYTVAPHP